LRKRKVERRNAGGGKKIEKFQADHGRVKRNVKKREGKDQGGHGMRGKEKQRQIGGQVVSLCHCGGWLTPLKGPKDRT